MSRPVGQPQDGPWRRRKLARSERTADVTPRIALGKAPCRVCGLPHWRPDGDSRCVGCELRAPLRGRS